MNVSFQWLTQNVAMPEFDRARVEGWLVEVAKSHGRIAHELSYIFCDDARILEVNREFLNHDYFTDIITFDYSHGRVVSGDMFISTETVASNAEGLNVSYDRELLRVIVHGVLHLCGINDKGPGEREIMERHENEALALYEHLCAASPEPSDSGECQHDNSYKADSQDITEQQD